MTGSIKERVREHLESLAQGAVEISHQVHSHAEVGFEEFRSSALLKSEFEKEGFEVESGSAGLPTAFVAKKGSGELQVGFCLEYDALPGIGHACGHNIIASSSYLAAAALAPFTQDLGISIRALGTPSEEGGGGKILMLEAGSFTGLNLAMMIHPGPAELDRMNTIAAKHIDIHFEGKPAHASAFAFLGINAQDAMVISQVALGLARQQLLPYEKVHGIVTQGGDAANIIPARVDANYIIRSDTLAHLSVLEPKIMRCFEAGALATGAKLTYSSPAPPYAELRTNEDLAGFYVQNATSLGRVFVKDDSGLTASTDMGNISLEVASIHPVISIDSLPAVNHQPEFTQAATTDVADKAVIEGALAMAWTVCDAATDGSVRKRLLAQSCR
ncbi:MAG: amidohydrolase [Acidimicrobiaceae bacterium]|nr:amidohydrolase [Acidimicrobiaceae bacterium]